MTEIYRWIEQQLELASNECRRLFHGRGGYFPGYESLVIDWFAPVVVIRLYDDVPPELIDSLASFFRARSGVQGVVLQQRGRGRVTAHETLFGEIPERLVCSELGLHYVITPAQFRNTGLFLDMRHGREWVKQQAAGSKVLNLFAYTCGFSVAAMAGGASSVVNVDMSKRALSIGRENHKLNGHDLSQVSFVGHDMFKSWGRIRRSGPFDLVVIDPPSFQPGSFVADNDYLKVLRRLPELTSPGARVLACHNDPAHDVSFIRNLVEEVCSEFKWKALLDPQSDFPDRQPERGVKAMVFARSD